MREPCPPSRRRRRVASSASRCLVAVGASRSPLVALAARAARARPPRAASHADFARDVAPIVRETCAGCHRLGGIAPFAFRTERDVATRARGDRRRASSAERMPPWPPGAASPRYVGQDAAHARRAGARRRCSAGRARSSCARAPRAAARPSARRRRRRSPPARRRDAPRPARCRRAYTPAASGGATDDYRCFLLDPKLAEDAFVTSARIEPGAGVARPPRDPLPRPARERRRRASALDRAARRARAGRASAAAASAARDDGGSPAAFLDDAGLDLRLGARLGRRPAARRHRDRAPGGQPGRDAGALQPAQRAAARPLARRAHDGARRRSG